jgi:hypothetical protein
MDLWCCCSRLGIEEWDVPAIGRRKLEKVCVGFENECEGQDSLGRDWRGGENQEAGVLKTKMAE